MVGDIDIVPTGVSRTWAQWRLCPAGTAQLLRDRGFDFGEYINPDNIAQELEGSYDHRVARAQALADQRREECIAEKQSFSFETVMSHPSKVDILVRARTAGFYVLMYFVGTDDPRINIDRVALRVAQGGHDVPTDRIVKRWHRTMGFLDQAIRASDEAFIFDNSASGPELAFPRLVLHTTSRPEGIVRDVLTRSIPDWVKHYALAGQ
jgi:predicted ABC-type ATPase